MVKSYSGPMVDESSARDKKGLKVLVPGSHWGSRFENDKPYEGTVLPYDAKLARKGPFFLVKLDSDKDNSFEYLLPWEKLVAHSNHLLPHEKVLKFVAPAGGQGAQGWRRDRSKEIAARRASHAATSYDSSEDEDLAASLPPSSKILNKNAKEKNKEKETLGCCEFML